MDSTVDSATSAEETGADGGATATVVTICCEEEQCSACDEDIDNLPAFVNEWGRKFPSCLHCGRANSLRLLGDDEASRDPSYLLSRRVLKEVCIKSIVPEVIIEEGSIEESFPFCLQCTESDIGRLTDLYRQLQVIQEEFDSVRTTVVRSVIRSYVHSTRNELGRNERKLYRYWKKFAGYPILDRSDEDMPGIKVEGVRVCDFPVNISESSDSSSGSEGEVVAVRAVEVKEEPVDLNQEPFDDDGMQGEFPFDQNEQIPVLHMNPSHSSESDSSASHTPPASLVDGCGSSTSDEDDTPLSQVKQNPNSTKGVSMRRNSELLSEANLPVIYTSSHSILNSVKTRRRTVNRKLLMIDREDLMGNIQISKKKKKASAPCDKSESESGSDESLKRKRIRSVVKENMKISVTLKPPHKHKAALDQEENQNDAPHQEKQKQTVTDSDRNGAKVKLKVPHKHKKGQHCVPCKGPLLTPEEAAKRKQEQEELDAIAKAARDKEERERALLKVKKKDGRGRPRKYPVGDSSLKGNQITKPKTKSLRKRGRPRKTDSEEGESDARSPKEKGKEITPPRPARSPSPVARSPSPPPSRSPSPAIDYFQEIKQECSWSSEGPLTPPLPTEGDDVDLRMPRENSEGVVQFSNILTFAMQSLVEDVDGPERRDYDVGRLLCQEMQEDEGDVQYVGHLEENVTAPVVAPPKKRRRRRKKGGEEMEEEPPKKKLSQRRPAIGPQLPRARPQQQQCSLCGKILTSAYSLMLHMRTHTNEKPYPCPHPGCEMRFTKPENLKAHSVKHSGVKRYECDVCSSRFSQKASLRSHKWSQHQIHESEALFECVPCAKKFLTLTVLKKHLRVCKNSVVSGDSDDEQCGNTSRYKSSSGKRVFCLYCEVFFNSPEDFAEHQNSPEHREKKSFQLRENRRKADEAKIALKAQREIEGLGQQKESTEHELLPPPPPPPTDPVLLLLGL